VYRLGGEPPAPPPGGHGSAAHPFSSLLAARDSVRALKSAGLPPHGAEISVSGLFKISEPLELDSRDSGEPGRPVVWRGTNAVLDGGFRVSGWRPGRRPREWTADLAKASCSAAKAPFIPFGAGVNRDDTAAELLFRDGAPLPVARDPDDGWYEISEVVDATNRVFRAEGFDYRRWSSAVGGYAVGFWTYFWADEATPFTVDPERRTIRLSDRVNEWTLPKVNHNFAVAGCAEALNAADEWFLDRSAGVIHLVAPDDSPPRGEFVFCETARPMFSVTGLTDVVVAGFRMRFGRGSCFVGGDVARLAVSNCLIECFGGWGVKLSNAASCTVSRCELRFFGHGAALLSGGGRARLVSASNRFTDNDVHDTGLVRKTYSPGLKLGGVGGTVAHNHFHDMPSSALRLGGNDHVVESNVIERCVLVSDDQGAIDTFGNPSYLGFKIRWNVWRDIGGGGRYAPCGQCAVRFDDFVSGALVFGNRFDNCSVAGFGAVQCNGGRANRVENNLFTRCRTALSMTFLSDTAWEKRWWDLDRRESFTAGPLWKARYPEIDSIRSMPQRNFLRRNVIIGDTRLLHGDKVEALAHMPDLAGENYVLPEGAAFDQANPPPGFEPLPPEKALGVCRP
ncbi:MAG: right-handed parallel beta-helix repeat-containing protein, partial [Kiritimatiellae bacterium]|nr:right-handed parallel beta-helix repeat-containing protein [Kiritimatiellia bacterium]